MFCGFQQGNYKFKGQLRAPSGLTGLYLIVWSYWTGIIPAINQFPEK